MVKEKNEEKIEIRNDEKIVLISIISLCYMTTFNVSAQVSMRIQEAEIVKYIDLYDQEGLLTHASFPTEGPSSNVWDTIPPVIRIGVELINVSRDTLNLYQTPNECRVHYRYDGEEYCQQLKDYMRIPMFFFLGTAPGKSITFDMTFIPDLLFKEAYKDLLKKGYGQMLFDIIPTMTVECIFNDEDNYTLIDDFSDWDEVCIINVEPDWDNIRTRNWDDSPFIKVDSLKRNIRNLGTIDWDNYIIRRSSDLSRKIW